MEAFPIRKKTTNISANNEEAITIGVFLKFNKANIIIITEKTILLIISIEIIGYCNCLNPLYNPLNILIIVKGIINQEP